MPGSKWSICSRKSPASDAASATSNVTGPPFSRAQTASVGISSTLVIAWDHVSPIPIVTRCAAVSAPYASSQPRPLVMA
jgi:hypothetical protein